MKPHLNILIVDDDDVDRMALHRALKAAEVNGDIEQATTGREGLDVLRKQSFDCVFLDYMLPDDDGLSVLRSLRAAGMDSPIIMLTGHGDERLAVEMMKAGASDYLSKAGMTAEVVSRSLQYVIRVHSAEFDRKRAEEEQRILIEKLKEAQDQLLQSEKLASIGQLAAGVAHEINNPIGYVSANLGALQRYVEDLLGLVREYQSIESMLSGNCPDVLARLKQARDGIDLEYTKRDIHDLVQECHEGIGRVKRIVCDLKDFSRVDETELQWNDLHQGLDSTLNVVCNELKHKAEVTTEYGELPQIECIASQLNQVFMNLLVNAAQAIEDRGTITVRTGTEGADWVWVEISDTGKGIEAGNMKRIFDPFFTTKPVGEGAGLGLSLSYGIVKKHGGRIDVQSETGKGTSFRIRLPVTRQGNQTAVSGQTD